MSLRQERVKDDYADDTWDNFRKGLIFCVCYSLLVMSLRRPYESLEVLRAKV